MPDARKEEQHTEHDGPEPSAKALITFGICLLMMIVAIILLAAFLGG